MQPGEVEFIADSGDYSPPEPVSTRPRIVRGLLGAALLAGGLAFALTRHSGHTPSAAPTPTLSRAPVVVNGATLPWAVGSPSANVACMPTAGCNVTSADLAEIDAAIAAYLPHATLSSVETSVESDHGYGNIGLKQRIIDAHLDSVDVLLRIRPYLRPEPVPTVGITPTPPGLGSAFFEYVTAAYVIDVQWTGTDATPPPSDQLHALATDPRLEALG